MIHSIEATVTTVMKDIIEGFLKFHSEAYPKRADLFKNLATKQNPRTLFISCSDSRLFVSLAAHTTVRAYPIQQIPVAV